MVFRLYTAGMETVRPETEVYPWLSLLISEAGKA